MDIQGLNLRAHITHPCMQHSATLTIQMANPTVEIKASPSGHITHPCIQHSATPAIQMEIQGLRLNLSQWAPMVTHPLHATLGYASGPRSEIQGLRLSLAPWTPWSSIHACNTRLHRLCIWESIREHGMASLVVGRRFGSGEASIQHSRRILKAGRLH